MSQSPARPTVHGGHPRAVGATVDPEPVRAVLQRRTVRSLAVAQVVGAIGVAVTPSIGVLLAEQVTSSEVWAGLARTGSTLGAALAGLPLATLAMRRGRRFALSLGWAVAALGAVLLVVAAQRQDVTALIIGLVLTGAGTAAQLQARFAATDLAEPATRGKALATVVWVGSLGSVLGPNLGAPGAWLAGRLGLAPLGGAFVFAAVAMILGAVAVLVLLRPDPLLVATGRQHSSPSSSTRDATGGDADLAAGAGAPAAPAPVPTRRRFAAIRAAAPLLREDHGTRTAFTAVITAQVVMVAIMTMTPVHLAAHGGSLTIVGVTISLHILGMYGLAPVAGALADRAGAAAGILTGAALFAASFVLAVIAAESTTAVVVSLVLLGLGWSFMGVAGSAWLGAAVPAEQRTAVQGLTDTSSNVAAAVGAFLSGPLMAVIGFSGLSIAAAVCLVPLGMMLLPRTRPTMRT